MSWEILFKITRKHRKSFESLFHSKFPKPHFCSSSSVSSHCNQKRFFFLIPLMKPLFSILLVLLPILCAFVFPFFFPLLNFNGHHDAPLPRQQQQQQALAIIKYPFQQRPQQQQLKLPSSSYHSLSPKPSTVLVAALDGTMYLMEQQESGSMRVLWSFSTGSPIYHSYEASINKDKSQENASTARISGFVECGDDWSLYMHDKHLGKMKIKRSIAEFVASTPTFSDDGAVILGSKRTTMFEVDAETGRIIHFHDMSAFDNYSAPLSADKKIVTNVHRIKENDCASPVKVNSPEMVLKIFRTDYSLQSVSPSSGAVLWTLTVAEFEAVLLCQHTPLDACDENLSDSDLNFALPYPCQEIQQVFRLQKNFLLEPSLTERLPGAYHGNDMRSMPASDLTLPLQLDGNMLPPAPLLYSSPEPKTGFYNSADDADMPPQHAIVITTPGEVYLNKKNKWSISSSFILVMVMGFSLLCYSLVVRRQRKDQSQSESKTSPAKKKRTRKSGKRNGTSDKKEKLFSSEDEDVLTQKDIDMESGTLVNFNHVDEGVDGRRIGKLLLLSNEEIAKGSNGTIIFEGIYEGRAVAVKRLVKAHHDVAYKEIQNLIVSDHHPNIVRWHGVEYDTDFVYLALERCNCSLDDLIQFYSNPSENPQNHAFKCLIKAQRETGKDNMQDLWKANGYPSPLLLKLMRDIVSGVVHLHELGIIHRDLKPQNVLIIKEKILCAKVSDMGISKRLLEDMSALDQNATGCGSSGWQAPEQLVQGRQTRAVDLFSLGCILFFCMTGGNHPFGERLERDVNIVKNRKNLFLVESIPEAEDLISCLLNHNPDQRPKAIEVLHHPFFWSSEMRLSFLRDTSDRVELEDREANSVLLNALESIATVALGGKWNEKMESAFITNIGRYRRYKFDSVRDLLRVMRNKLNHYRELPQEIQELVGPLPEGFNEYFSNRFPRLLIEVFKVISKYCKDEECFQRYFKKC